MSELDNSTYLRSSKVCSSSSSSVKPITLSNCFNRKFVKAFICFAIILFVTSARDVDACSCIFSHPQEHYCSADFVALINIRRQGKNLYNMASYHIKVRKEFKMTTKARKALSLGMLYTTIDESTCGRKFETNTKYLITGKKYSFVIISSKSFVKSRKNINI